MLVCGIHALSDACFLLCWSGRCGSVALWCGSATLYWSAIFECMNCHEHHSAALCWSAIFECMNCHEHHGYHVTPCTPWMLRYRGVPTLHLKYVHLAFEAKIWIPSIHTFRGSSLYNRIQNLNVYQSLVSFSCVVINHQKWGDCKCI